MYNFICTTTAVVYPALHNNRCTLLYHHSHSLHIMDVKHSESDGSQRKRKCSEYDDQRCDDQRSNYVTKRLKLTDGQATETVSCST